MPTNKNPESYFNLPPPSGGELRSSRPFRSK